MLAAEGLVDEASRRGAFVVMLDRETSARSTIFARDRGTCRLCPRLARIRARSTASRRRWMRCRAGARAGDRRAIRGLDLAFHEEVCRASGNDRLLDVFHRYVPALHTLLAYDELVYASLEVISEQHQAIYDAIRSGVPADAAAAVAAHCEEARDQVSAHFELAPAASPSARPRGPRAARRRHRGRSLDQQAVDGRPRSGDATAMSEIRQVEPSASARIGHAGARLEREQPAPAMSTAWSPCTCRTPSTCPSSQPGQAEGRTAEAPSDADPRAERLDPASASASSAIARDQRHDGIRGIGERAESQAPRRLTRLPCCAGPAVERGSCPGRRPERLPVDRVVHDAHDHRRTDAEGDADREERNPRREHHGAIDGIDDPGPRRPASRIGPAGSTLLADEAIPREGCAKIAARFVVRSGHRAR